MKLSKNWPGNKQSHKPKRIIPKPKIPWKSLGLPDPDEDQTPISTEEVRRQVLQMSSRGLAGAVRTRRNPKDVKDDDRKVRSKPRRGATE